MNQVLDNCSFAMTYLDDIIIFSETEEQHLAHIEEIFKQLEAADLKMKRSKCDFFKKHIHYLGHLYISRRYKATQGQIGQHT